MQYETVIGLETHVELSTKSKIFCGCSTAFGGEPNTQCCPICTGMPGVLPVLNEKVVEYTVKAGMALNCEISRYNRFDRKNYFYPDLPKAYQISQLYLPICQDGSLEIGGGKSIGIREIHMEEDAGKLVHDAFSDASLADYNRCGVPLIEIVTQPDFRSGEEVIEYLTRLKSILEYLGVSDCKMQEGSMRADVNLSIRPVGQEAYGVRTEMKNMNSFKAIARAIEYEAKRQIELLESGKQVVQETRRWDENKDASFAMRSKENAQDYRYFPEPDIPPLELSEAYLADIRESLPELPAAKKARYRSEYGLPEYDTDIITGTAALARLFEGTVALCGKSKEVSNWIMGDLLRLVKNADMDASDVELEPQKLADVIGLLADGKVNRSAAREAFEAAFQTGADPKRYVEENGLLIVTDTGALETAVEEVLAENQKIVQDYLGGKEKAFGALVGNCMKKLRGKADPAAVNRLLHEKLGK